MNINLIELSNIWSNYLRCGITALKLTYTSKNTLEIEARCTDDCEPYWNWVTEEECPVEDYARLVTHIANGDFYNQFGEPRKVICKMEEIQ